MKKITLTCKEFLLFCSVCKKFSIAFELWTKPGGVYVVQADKIKLAEIGY